MENILKRMETEWDFLQVVKMFECKSLKLLVEAESLWEVVKTRSGQNGVDRLVTIITAFTQFSNLEMRCR